MRGVWFRQVIRVMSIEVAVPVLRRDDHRHAIMQGADEFISSRRDDGERPNPFARFRVLPILPQPGKGEWLNARHGDHVRQFLFADLSPLVKLSTGTKQRRFAKASLNA